MLLINALAQALDDPLQLMTNAMLNVPADALRAYSDRAAALARAIRAKDQALIRRLVTRVQVLAGSVEISCDAGAMAQELGVTLLPEAPASLLLVSNVRLTRSGLAMRLVGEGGPPPALDQSLVRLLAQARRYWLELKHGEIDVTRLASREGVSGSWLTRVLRLAFLSPKLVEMILAGKQPPGTTVAAFMRTEAIQAGWGSQVGTLAAGTP